MNEDIYLDEHDWPDPCGLGVKHVGLPAWVDESYVLLGSVASGRYLLAFGLEGTLVAALTVGYEERVALLLELVVNGHTVGDALQVIAASRRTT